MNQCQAGDLYIIQVMLTKAVRRFGFAGSVNQGEMDLFNTLKGWWHPSGPSQMLYHHNYHRIEFLRRSLPNGNSRRPLDGMDVLDVGCGAGFLSESMARLGGRVTALDPNPTSYSEAIAHKGTKTSLSNLTYFNQSLQSYLQRRQAESPRFNLVASMEVIEHVDNPQAYIQTIASCVAPQGLVMLSTIRRSLSTWLTHIVGAERILGLVPAGTHHHDKFINPEQLKKMLHESGLESVDLLELEVGWRGDFEKKYDGGNYLIMAKKRADDPVK